LRSPYHRRSERFAFGFSKDIRLIDGEFSVEHNVAAHGADSSDDIGERAVQEVALSRYQFDARAALPGQTANSIVLNAEALPAITS
jgi:hypothetical protein